jgi:hypothetical protein
MGLTVFLGDIAEVLEELAVELMADEKCFGPSGGRRAGDVAEAVPVARTGDERPEDEDANGPDGDGGDVEGHSLGMTATIYNARWRGVKIRPPDAVAGY